MRPLTDNDFLNLQLKYKYDDTVMDLLKRLAVLEDDNKRLKSVNDDLQDEVGELHDDIRVLESELRELGADV